MMRSVVKYSWTQVSPRVCNTHHSPLQPLGNLNPFSKPLLLVWTLFNYSFWLEQSFIYFKVFDWVSMLSIVKFLIVEINVGKGAWLIVLAFGNGNGIMGRYGIFPYALAFHSMFVEKFHILGSRTTCVAHSNHILCIRAGGPLGNGVLNRIVGSSKSEC